MIEAQRPPGAAPNKSETLPQQPRVACPFCANSTEDEVVALFDELRAPLLRYLLTFRMGVPDAEEIVQETFLRLSGTSERTNPAPICTHGCSRSRTISRSKTAYVPSGRRPIYKSVCPRDPKSKPRTSRSSSVSCRCRSSAGTGPIMPRPPCRRPAVSGNRGGARNLTGARWRIRSRNLCPG